MSNAMNRITKALVPALCAALLLVACGGGGDSAESPGRAIRLDNPPGPASAPILAATWTALPNPNYAPPLGPYTRAWTEMTWNSSLQQMVVFGGNSSIEYANDLWAYNDATSNWTEIDPHVVCPGNSGFSKPNGTDDTAFKYDPVNNLYWVFGVVSGYRCLSFATVRTAAAGSTTSTLVDPTLTAVDPGDYVNWRVRVGNVDAVVTAYDAALKRLTLATPIAALGPDVAYKLYASTTEGIWYFDPVTRVWTGQDTPAGNTGPTPVGARIAPAVAFSDADKAFVFFGGKATGTPDKSVWRLYVVTKTWTQLPVPATGSPPQMREMLNSLVYDQQNNVFILFGGICMNDSSCVDATPQGKTWAYTLATNTWVNMNPAGAPSARAQHVMTYDAANGVVVLFGGATQTGVTGDTWTYHYPSNTWTQYPPPVAPSPRYLSQITYDPVKNRTVVFSGSAPSGTQADIWALKLVPTVGLPTVSLTGPAPGTVFAAPANITLTVNAVDNDGSIAKVEYFSAATKLGESTVAPFSFSWAGVAAGSYSVTERVPTTPAARRPLHR